MDTLNFLKTILPSRGVYYLMRKVPRPNHPKGDATIHEVAGDVDDLADMVLQQDRKGDQNIYYAMASYKEAQYKTTKLSDGREFTYIVGRKKSNVAWVKSLWMDWDVGKDNTNSYASQRDALDAMKAYVKATGLPAPIVVSSGYGLHSYWLFTEEVDITAWEGVAKYQRVIMRHLGIKFDPSRDLDAASVLRPAGARNKKPGAEPRAVKVLRVETTPLPPMEFRRIFQRYVTENNLGTEVKPDPPPWAVGFGNIDSVETKDFPESFGEIVAQHCKQLQEFKETGGEDEPRWYACLGVLKHCADGEKLAHEYGKTHPRYSADETQAKLDQWPYGPTTCDKFREVNPTACEGCPHKCKSPIQLGKTEAPKTTDLTKVEPTPTAVIEAATQATTLDENGVPFAWPQGYGFDKDNVYRKVRDPEGVWQDVRIASPLFYPVDQIMDEEGTLVLRMHIWVRGRVREFLLPAKHTADKRSLKMQLHANGAHVIDDQATANFISKYKMEIQARREEIRTYNQMGWKHDFSGFLIGDKLVTVEGERQVVMGKNFPAELCGINNPTGTKEEWVQGVDTLYNRKHGEPYQFSICAAFAAPLHDLLGFSEWRGIPYALTTDESGFGKTTVNMIAQSIWGDPEAMKISDSTPKATLGIASAFNNIPFILDEVTQYLKDPADMATVLYAMSNGRPRLGMSKDGRLRESTPPWIGCCAMTGNRNILMQLSENKLLPEATQMRVFEIDLDTYPRLTSMDKTHPDFIHLNPTHNAISKTLPATCHSIIGPEYVRYIMENLTEVRARLRKTAAGFAKLVDGDATKERFYYHLITCVLVGGYYAKQLGYIHFSLNNLRDWCIAHVNRLRGAVQEARQTPEDRFYRILADLQGSLLVTKNFSNIDGRTQSAQVHLGQQIRGPISGRFVLGDEKERPKLYVTVRALQQWCADHGEHFPALRRDFLADNLIRLGHPECNKKTGAVRITLAKGVAGVPGVGNPWCVELDANKAIGMAKLYDAKIENLAEYQEAEAVAV